jgi:geranylgeranyl reductase family protein
MRDVVVIGGGPGGLVAAKELASRGAAVTVLEEHQAIGAPVHCTGVLAEDVFDTLALPREAILNPLSTVRFVGPSGGSFSYTTPSVEAVVIDRRVFDDTLSRRAELAGAVVHRGLRVSRLEPRRDGVRVSLDGAGALMARSAILACGAHYGLQRRLGLGMPSVFLQSAQRELAVRRSWDVEVHFGSGIAPKGFAWAVPVERPTGPFVRVGVMAARDVGRFFTRMLERVRGRWGIDTPDDLQPRRRILPLGPISRSYGDRLLVVGDAAGLVKPTTGGGIYYSIISGMIAADVLAHGLEADALAAADLREYERRWRRRFQPEFTAQMVLRFIAERMRDADIDALFELAGSDAVSQLVRKTARFNRHRDFIVALLRHGPARRVMLRSLTNFA